jgi:hypothetical protein
MLNSRQDAKTVPLLLAFHDCNSIVPLFQATILNGSRVLMSRPRMIGFGTTRK